MPNEPRVFLCHNTKEKPEINQIRSFLEERNIRTYMDQYDFQSFGLWEKQLEAEIRTFKTAAIFLGKSGLGPWQVKEIDMFVDELNKNAEDRRMGLVILPGCSNRLIDEVTEKWPDLSKWQWTNFDQDEPDPVERLILGISATEVDSNLSLEQKLRSQKENRRLRSELFQTVANGFQEELERLLQVISREKARIREIDREITQIILEEEIDPRLKSVEKMLRERASAFARIASEFALNDMPEFHSKNKSLEFQESMDWFQTELVNYIERIGISLVTSDFELLYEPMEHRSGLPPEIYIKALNQIKGMIPDFTVEAEIFKTIEESIDVLVKVMKYQ